MQAHHANQVSQGLRGKARTHCLGLLVATLTGVLLASAFSSVEAADPSLRPVRRYRATLVPVERTPIAAPVDGIVTRYRIAEGSVVAAGAVLLELDASDARFDLQIATAELVEARALLQQATRELAAMQVLLRSESTKRLEVERAEAQCAVAKARVEKAEARVARASWRLECHAIEAPAEGVLFARRKLPGQGVRAFETTCELFDPARLFAVIQVPVTELPELVVGKKAEFHLPDGRVVPGTCAEIGLEVNPGANTVQVKVELANEARLLRPGSAGEVVVEAP